MPLSPTEIAAVRETASMSMMWGVHAGGGWKAYVRGKTLFSSDVRSNFVSLWNEAEEIRAEEMRKEIECQRKQ